MLRTFCFSKLCLQMVLILMGTGAALAVGCSKGSGSSEDTADTLTDVSTESDASTESVDSASVVIDDTETEEPGDTESVSDTDTGTDWDRTVIGNVPFADDQILLYHFTMDAALLEEMIEEGDDEAFRETALRVTGDNIDVSFAKVGLRYKGDYSLHHCWNSGYRSTSGDCAKLSLKIGFDEYDDHARFYGLKKINLNSMSSDGSKMRERLAYGMYSEFNVDAPRTAYAQVQINDEPPFLALAVEQVDGRYTAHHYIPGGDGNLFKELWPRDTLSEYAALEALKTNENDSPDVSGFLEFGKAVSAATVEDFVQTVGPLTDISHLLRYMAVDRAIKNWDGVTAFYWPERPHNFYWYFDEGNTEKYWIIPWDLDNTFRAYDPYMDPEQLEADEEIPNWNVYPESCDGIVVWNEFPVMPPGCDPLLHMLAATGWDEFAKLGEDLLAGPFQYDVVNGKITRWQEQIAAIVEADPYLYTSSWEYDVEELREILQRYVDDFALHLQEGYIDEQAAATAP